MPLMTRRNGLGAALFAIVAVSVNPVGFDRGPALAGSLGGFESRSEIKVHRAGQWPAGNIRTHRAGEWPSGNIRIRRAGEWPGRSFRTRRAGRWPDTNPWIHGAGMGHRSGIIIHRM